MALFTISSFFSLLSAVGSRSGRAELLKVRHHFRLDIPHNYEAKALGLKMGDPYHLKQAELKKHRVSVFSSNYTLYGDMSRRVMQTLTAFTPELEIYSIDEAFLNLAGFEHRGLTDYARLIRAEVKQATGIPVSIGIGVTKTLAKIANRLAKKTPESGGVWNLLDVTRCD